MSKPALFQTARELMPFLYELPCRFGEYIDYRRSSGKVSATRSGKKAEVKISASGVQDLCNPIPMTIDSVVDIASIGKQFTAATLLKLCDEEAFAEEQQRVVRKNFPKGIDTPISHFMDGLKARFPQPNCLAALERIEKDADYEKITLRDLLNHRHGLGSLEGKKIGPLFISDKQDPLELHEIIGAVTKEKGEYGVFQYSNLGPDLAAMIIEVVEGKPFDDVVRDTILVPNGLMHTYPQVHAVVQFGVNSKMTRGHKIRGFEARNPDDPAEFLRAIHMNSRPVTRAAAGFKTTMDDLVRFSDLFMGAEMFQSEEIKKLVLERKLEEGDVIPGGEGNSVAFTYHLAISKKEGSDIVGHQGGSYICSADLSYNPRSGEVSAYAEVMENITYSLSALIFRRVFPDQKNFLENGSEFCKFTGGFHGKVDGKNEEQRIAILEEAMKKNPEGANLFRQYAAIVKDVLEHPENLKNMTEAELEVFVSRAKARQRDMPSVYVSSPRVAGALSSQSNEL